MARVGGWSQNVWPAGCAVFLGPVPGQACRPGVCSSCVGQAEPQATCAGVGWGRGKELVCVTTSSHLDCMRLGEGLG